MQQVSQAWKDAQRLNFVPESFVEVSLRVGDPQALADAAASDNGSERFSNTAQIVEEVEKDPRPFSTLEQNLWILDGTFEVVPDTPPYGNNGYIGNVLSGADGTYETIPTITISFSQVYDRIIPGITITWGTAYDDMADTFRVTAYNGASVVSEKTVEGNRDVVSIVEFDIQNYDRITVEVLKWGLPYRRARIEEILIGIEKVYTKSNLMSYTHTMFVDPMSATLPKSEIVFKITNLNGEYNPDNPRGAEKYLMERQEITARYGYRLGDSVEWIRAGTFYLSGWETPQNGISATFTARDALEYMSDDYEGTSSGTLMDIAVAASEQAGLTLMPDGSSRWVLDASLSGITVPADVDLTGVSIAEVLQYVANAACCVFYQDRDGRVHIEPLPTGRTDYTIDPFVSYANSEISLTKQLKSVDVNDGMVLLPVGDVGETQKVSNLLVSESQAPAVAQWAADFLVNRKLLTGEFRADPRLDALDRVTNINQFAENVVLVTEIRYTYNGAFRGSYDGRADV